MTNFRTEFPDYPVADMPTMPAGFEDVSWHNDTCPSFEHKAHGFRVFVDYPDNNMREFPGGARFALYALDEDGSMGDGIPLLESSSWNEMNAVVIDYTT